METITNEQKLFLRWINTRDVQKRNSCMPGGSREISFNICHFPHYVGGHISAPESVPDIYTHSQVHSFLKRRRDYFLDGNHTAVTEF